MTWLYSVSLLIAIHKCYYSLPLCCNAYIVVFGAPRADCAVYRLMGDTGTAASDSTSSAEATTRSVQPEARVAKPATAKGN